MNHFDEMTCLLYLERQLERPRAEELAAHAAACAECRALLRAIERESRLLAQALVEEDEPVPARLLAPPARNATSWAWIISFGLASAGAYTLWTGIVEPWRQQLSQAGFAEDSLLTLLFFRGAFWKGWGDMLNAMQFLAILILGMVAFGLLRRTWRHWTTIAVVLCAFVVALALPPAASAAETIHTQSYNLRSGEVVHNDLFVFSSKARIDGTVEGDLVVFTQNLTVDGHVTGDVIACVQFAQINGQVDGNVRAFSDRLSLRGKVGKNVTGFVGGIELDSNAQVGGSATLFARGATLDGRIARDLLAHVGRADLNGFVGGNAQMGARHQLTIGPNAEIRGKATFSGPSAPEVSPSAKLASPLEIKIVKHRPDYASPRFYLRLGMLWGVAFLFGVLIALLLPGFFADVVRSSDHYGVSLGVGAITLVACMVLAVIAVLLLFIGLAGGVVVLLLFAPALYSAQVFVGTWLGEKLLGPSTGTGDVLGRLALGLLVIRVVWLVPYLGWIIWLAVHLWGVGALTLTLYKTARPQVATAA